VIITNFQVPQTKKCHCARALETLGHDHHVPNTTDAGLLRATWESAANPEVKDSKCQVLDGPASIHWMNPEVDRVGLISALHCNSCISFRYADTCQLF